ncbi:MAG TPA: hypothetical protein VFA45_20670 [Actinomycetes bacterium]|jgi:hypothetical protein|nr:hypothetical protein [Actinomycetes bacterium]
MSDQMNGAGDSARSTEAAEAAALGWHLDEAAAVLRHQPTPLSPEVLRVALRGVGELCRVLFERGQENPAEPPYLFRDNAVVSEALAMWERRVRAAMSEQHATAEDGR